MLLLHLLLLYVLQDYYLGNGCLRCRCKGFLSHTITFRKLWNLLGTPKSLIIQNMIVFRKKRNVFFKFFYATFDFHKLCLMIWLQNLTKLGLILNWNHSLFFYMQQCFNLISSNFILLVLFYPSSYFYFHELNDDDWFVFLNGFNHSIVYHWLS